MKIRIDKCDACSRSICETDTPYKVELCAHAACVIAYSYPLIEECVGPEYRDACSQLCALKLVGQWMDQPKKTEVAA